jgi:hypothetical protein
VTGDERVSRDAWIRLKRRCRKLADLDQRKFWIWSAFKFAHGVIGVDPREEGRVEWFYGKGTIQPMWMDAIAEGRGVAPLIVVTISIDFANPDQAAKLARYCMAIKRNCNYTPAIDHLAE